MLYDVIVVGAGPAGSTTARLCAQAGMKVLLLDRAKFPRDEPCGGALTRQAAAMVPVDVLKVAERSIDTFRLSLRLNGEFVRESAERLVYMTQRSALDSLMAEKAMEAGTDFIQQAPIRSIVSRRGCTEIRANGRVYQGLIEVGADGVALEASLTPSGGAPGRWRSTVGVDVGDLPGGYGWLLPKRDHVNIGLGVWKYLATKLKERLEALVRFYGFHPLNLWGLRGHHLSLYNAGSTIGRGNVLLTGDAAGLVDPLTGEGIGNALLSGHMAARAAGSFVSGKTGDLSSYSATVHREIIPSLNFSRKLHDIFHLSPGLYVFFDRRTRLLWQCVRAMLPGRANYSGVRKRLGPVGVIDLVSDLIRVPPSLQPKAGLRVPHPPERYFRQRFTAT